MSSDAAQTPPAELTNSSKVDDGGIETPEKTREKSLPPRKVSIAQACEFVGIGEETLLRFMESGYFPGASRAVGINVADLEAIFGVRIPAPFIKPSLTTKTAASFSGSSFSGSSPSSYENPAIKSVEDLPVEGQDGERLKAAKVIQAIFEESDSRGMTQPADTGPVASGPIASGPIASGPIASDHVTTDHVVASDTVATSDEEAPFTSVPRRTLIEMYERLFSQLQSELKSVKSERDWLKTRIERYEEKSARDQLLMLAETQTIKSLIASHRPEKSPMRAALEWFGLVQADIATGMSPASDKAHSTAESADHTNGKL